MICTLVSLAPFETIESKPGLKRGFYKIPKAERGSFEIVYIGDSSWTQRLPGTNQQIEVPEAGEKIAQSIINDYCTSHVCSSPNAHPGMFFVTGKFSKEEIEKNCKEQLAEALKKQEAWFIELVKTADDDWNQFHNQKLINEHQRYAADYLNIHDRDWLVEYGQMAAQLKDCPACFSRIDARAIKCPTCGAILDIEKAKQFGFIASSPNVEHLKEKMSQLTKDK